MVIRELKIRRPDDMHLHVRDGLMMQAVLPESALHFARGIIMPNLLLAVKTVRDATLYRDRIIAALERILVKDFPSFEPLMTLYLTEETSTAEIELAAKTPFIHAFKYYPQGATTNSAEGVRDLKNVTEQLRAMDQNRIPLLLHGEVNVDSHGRGIDPFDKEVRFVERLPELLDTHRDLRIVLEHITTKEAVEFVEEYGSHRVGATITPHHLFEDRRALFDGGLNPHHFCLPVLKREEDMLALRKLATSGNKFVFAGTDSAPHPTHAKERACGCAGGCFVAPVALSMYAEVFEQEKALHNLEAFLSENGANWYELPLNEEEITLVRHDEPKAPPENKAEDPALDVRVFGVHTDPAKSLKWHWQPKNLVYVE